MSDNPQNPTTPPSTVFIPSGASAPPPGAPSAPPMAPSLGTPQPFGGPAPVMGADGVLPPGTELNHMYRITRFIAKGGMGMVYEGQGIYDNERVAIKTILPHLAADASVIAMFQREASTLTQLRHEALVQYRGLTKEPQYGFFYLVTEFIDGRSLEKIMDDGKVPTGEAISLLRRLASGLAIAHSVGCVHRDIAPDNVLVPGGDMHKAKVIDFGIARDAKATTGTIVGDGFAGKLSFAAPEQFGKYGREIGPWTDVYSLGLVIAAAARGKEIDMGGTMADALDRRAVVPDLSDVEEPLRGVLAAMLEPEPARRLRDMPAVIARLDAAPAAAGGKTGKKTAPPKPAAPAAKPAAKPATPSSSGAQSKSGLPLPVLLGGGGVLAAIVVAGIAALALRPPAPPEADSAATEIVADAPALPTAPVADVTRLAVRGPAPAAIAGLPPDARDRLATLMTALEAIPCAWLNVEATPEGTFEIRGAALDKNRVIDAAVAAQGRARVGQLSGSICPNIDAMRQRMVAPGEGLDVRIRQMPNGEVGLQAVVSGVPAGGELYLLELDRNKGFLPILDLRDPELEYFRKILRDGGNFSGSIARGGDFTFQFQPSEDISDGKNGVVAIAAPVGAPGLDAAFRAAAAGLLKSEPTQPVPQAELISALEASGAWTVAMDFYPPEP